MCSGRCCVGCPPMQATSASTCVRGSSLSGAHSPCRQDLSVSHREQVCGRGRHLTGLAAVLAICSSPSAGSLRPLTHPQSHSWLSWVRQPQQPAHLSSHAGQAAADTLTGACQPLPPAAGACRRACQAAASALAISPRQHSSSALVSACPGAPAASVATCSAGLESAQPSTMAARQAVPQG